LYASKESVIARFSTPQDKMILIRSHKMKNGYMRITYRDNVCDGGTGKSNNYLVHKIVLETFISKPSNDPSWEVGHIDGNRKNNRLSNLFWITRQANLKQRDMEGRLLKPVFVYDRKENTEEKFKSRIAAAEALNVQRSNLSNAIKKELVLQNRYYVSDIEMFPDELVYIFKA
jgi:hypothetical protein